MELVQLDPDIPSLLKQDKKNFREFGIDLRITRASVLGANYF